MKKGLLTMAGVLLTVSLVSAGTTVPVLAEEETTLVYGSGDYTRINPAMDEHGEINILIFNTLQTEKPQNPIRMFLLYMQIMKRRLLPYWKIIYIRVMNMRLLP